MDDWFPKIRACCSLLKSSYSWLSGFPYCSIFYLLPSRGKLLATYPASSKSSGLDCNQVIGRGPTTAIKRRGRILSKRGTPSVETGCEILDLIEDDVTCANLLQ